MQDLYEKSWISTAPEIQQTLIQQKVVENESMSSDVIQADVQCLISYILSHVW